MQPFGSVGRVLAARARLRMLLVATAALAASAQAGAQTYSPPAPSLQGEVMAGYSATSGETANFLQDGWTVDGGVIYWLAPSGLGIRADLSYSDHSATRQFRQFGEQATGLAVDSGYGDFSAVSAGLVWRVPLSRWVHFYALAQAGVTHVQLRLEQTFYVPGYYCDPFFYYCSYPAVDAATVYSFHTNRFSWDAGLGIDFPAGFASSWFIEAQYRRIDTSPQPFEYWPITGGLRF